MNEEVKEPPPGLPEGRRTVKIGFLITRLISIPPLGEVRRGLFPLTREN